MLTQFAVCIDSLQDPNNSFKREHPPTVRWSELCEEGSNVDSSVVIWAKLNIRVEVQQTSQVSHNVFLESFWVMFWCPVGCCPAHGDSKVHDAFEKFVATDNNFRYLFRRTGFLRPKLRDWNGYIKLNTSSPLICLQFAVSRTPQIQRRSLTIYRPISSFNILLQLFQLAFRDLVDEDMGPFEFVFRFLEISFAN